MTAAVLRAKTVDLVALSKPSILVMSLLTAAGMLIGLLGLLTALVNAHMPVGKPPLMEAARTAGKMVLLGAPLMAVLFVLFPRVAPLWGIPTDGPSGRSGLSATMQVGTIAKLALDESIALRIKFEGRVPQPQDLYFRGPVLSVFDGREWRAAPARGSFGTPADLRVFGTPVRYQVTMEPSNRPWLLVLDAAAAPPELGGYDVFMSPTLQWFTNRPVSESVRYEASSYVDFRHGASTSSARLSEFTALPAGFNPRTSALAAQMLAEPRNRPADTAALVAQVMQRLQTGGYQYTLEPGVYGANTADEFWFDRRQGFCEHIASAFVILMRALGVPARVVTGYQGGDRNPVDGYWVLRQSDAHAWAEVWHNGRGWVRVDPTAAVAPGRVAAIERLSAPRGVLASAMDTLDPTLLVRLRATWEAINNEWNQRVLDFSQNRQFELLRNIGLESPSWEDLSYLLIGLVVTASLLGALWTLWERGRQDPWLRLLASAQRRLAAAGLTVAQHTGPRALAALARARWGEHARPLQDWLLRLESERYAKTPRQGLARLRRDWRNLAWPS